MADKLERTKTLAELRMGGKRRRGAKAPSETEQPILSLFDSIALDSVSFVQETAEESLQVSVSQTTEIAMERDAPPRELERRVWTVAALVNEIRGRVEARYADLWVAGEISNWRPSASGHCYFTLKDGEAQLPIVMFRRQATLLKWRPADGMAVLARGRISVYESRGQLQLIAETMEPRGAGALQIEFEQRKERLRAEGIFDAERKRPLPEFPRCIGVITSLQGAVVRDMVTVGRRRHAKVSMLVYPAAVQGPSCASEVMAGLAWFNAHPGRADVVVIARGGGSAEDLSGFNDEALARAIAASELPVVSAVGHETDFTIADFVADLRAPTPSAAAELVTAAQHRVEERVEELHERVLRAGRYRLVVARQRFARLSSEAVLGRLRDAVSRREQRLDELRFRRDAAWQRLERSRGARLAALVERLRRQDVSLRLVGGRRKLEALHARLVRAPERDLTAKRVRVERVTARLEGMSPLAVLGRGYALVYGADGRLLRSTKDVGVGEEVEARLASGRLRARVTEAEGE